jgi:hypothetical protein
LILSTALKSASKNTFLGPAYCQIKQENTSSTNYFPKKKIAEPCPSR